MTAGICEHVLAALRPERIEAQTRSCRSSEMPLPFSTQLTIPSAMSPAGAGRWRMGRGVALVEETQARHDIPPAVSQTRALVPPNVGVVGEHHGRPAQPNHAQP